MNWLRNNGNPADVDDPTAQGLANLAELPMPGSLSPEEKARVVDSVNWLRNNDVKPGRQRAHSCGSEHQCRRH
jgi:hypothetical protein